MDERYVGEHQDIMMEIQFTHILRSNLMKCHPLRAFLTKNMVCMQQKHVYNNRCNQHLRQVFTISIIRFAHRTMHLQIHVQNAPKIHT